VRGAGNLRGFSGDLLIFELRRWRRHFCGDSRNWFALLFLETGTAQNWSALRRLEWYRRFRTASGTCRSGLRANPSSACPLCLALLAVLGVVLKLLVVEKQLLTRGEHKLGAAVSTLQYSVNKFHGRLPQSREERSKSAMNVRACRSRFPVFDRPVNNKGPGRHNVERQCYSVSKWTGDPAVSRCGSPPIAQRNYNESHDDVPSNLVLLYGPSRQGSDPAWAAHLTIVFYRT